MNLHKIIASLEQLLDALKEPGLSHDLEPVLTNSQLQKLYRVNRHTVARLKKEGRVKTYENGRKAKASEVLMALQDKPVSEGVRSHRPLTVHRNGSYPHTTKLKVY